MGFLSELRIFSDWDYHKLKMFYINCDKMQYKRGDVIYNEGDSPDHVYIIKKG